MRIKLKIVLVLVIIIGSLKFSFAQEYNKVNGIWNAAFLDFKLSNKMSLRTEVHLRTISYFSVWNQHLFRPQLSYKASKNITWIKTLHQILEFEMNTIFGNKFSLLYP